MVTFDDANGQDIDYLFFYIDNMAKSEFSSEEKTKGTNHISPLGSIRFLLQKVCSEMKTFR